MCLNILCRSLDHTHTHKHIHTATQKHFMPAVRLMYVPERRGALKRTDTLQKGAMPDTLVLPTLSGLSGQSIIIEQTGKVHVNKLSSRPAVTVHAVRFMALRSMRPI